MSAILNLTEAKAKFSEVVERVSRDEEIIVTRMGYPVACRSTRYEPGAANRRLGLLEGRIRIAEDLDIWPQDIARDFGMADRACASWSTPIALLWALDEASTLSRKLVLIPRELDIARYDLAVLPC